MSIGAGAVSDVAEAATKETSNIVPRLFRFCIFILTLQQTRKTVDLILKIAAMEFKSSLWMFMLLSMSVRTGPWVYRVDGAQVATASDDSVSSRATH